MNQKKALALPACTALAIVLLTLGAPALAQEVTGEWSTDADACGEMRVVYAEDGSHPTEVNADGEWVVVNESTWERDGDVLHVTTQGRTESWDIVHLDAERMELVNQDPEAEELDAGRSELFRCEPR